MKNLDKNSKILGRNSKFEENSFCVGGEGVGGGQMRHRLKFSFF